MDYNEMVRKVLEIFPHAVTAEDNDGQLVIYTDMKCIMLMPARTEIVVPFTSHEN